MKDWIEDLIANPQPPNPNLLLQRILAIRADIPEPFFRATSPMEQWVAIMESWHRRHQIVPGSTSLSPSPERVEP